MCICLQDTPRRGTGYYLNVNFLLVTLHHTKGWPVHIKFYNSFENSGCMRNHAGSVLLGPVVVAAAAAAAAAVKGRCRLLARDTRRWRLSCECSLTTYCSLSAYMYW